MQKSVFSRGSELLRERLVDMRRRAGLTQRELAARLDRPQNLVARAELGERRIDVLELVEICRACEADPEIVVTDLVRALVELEPEPGPPRKKGRRPRPPAR